jgi:hypothetical protein
VKCTSLGSLSEASQVFDPGTARTAVGEPDLRARTPARDIQGPGRQGRGHRRAGQAEGLPGRSRSYRAGRLRLRGASPDGMGAPAPEGAQAASGCTSTSTYSRGFPWARRSRPRGHARRRSSRSAEEKGRLYVYDRGLADYGLFQKVIDAGSSFQVRHEPPCGT